MNPNKTNPFYDYLYGPTMFGPNPCSEIDIDYGMATGYYADMAYSNNANPHSLNPDALAFAAKSEAKHVEICVKHFNKALVDCAETVLSLNPKAVVTMKLNKLGEARLALMAAMVSLEKVLKAFYGSEVASNSPTTGTVSSGTISGGKF